MGKVYVSNAFSIQMLDGDRNVLVFQKINLDELKVWFAKIGLQKEVGLVKRLEV